MDETWRSILIFDVGLDATDATFLNIIGISSVHLKPDVNSQALKGDDFVRSTDQIYQCIVKISRTRAVRRSCHMQPLITPGFFGNKGIDDLAWISATCSGEVLRESEIHSNSSQKKGLYYVCLDIYFAMIPIKLPITHRE